MPHLLNVWLEYPAAQYGNLKHTGFKFFWKSEQPGYLWQLLIETQPLDPTNMALSFSQWPLLCINLGRAEELKFHYKTQEGEAL